MSKPRTEFNACTIHPSVREAAQLARQTSAFFRSVEQALLGGHNHWAAACAQDGYREAQKALAAAIKIGDPKKGLEELRADTAIHSASGSTYVPDSTDA